MANSQLQTVEVIWWCINLNYKELNGSFGEIEILATSSTKQPRDHPFVCHKCTESYTTGKV